MRVFLIHVRDPQFYALPAKTRAKNGNIRVMGFPPIGIMSLSSVLKQAGHECVMFDQANPETPNEVIIEEINATAGPGRPEFPQHHQLSLRQDSRPPDSRRQLESQTGVRRRLCELERRVGETAVSGSGFRLPRRRRAAASRSARALDDPAGVAGLTWAKDGKVVQNPGRPMERHLDQWPFPDRESLQLDFVESMPLDVPAVLSMERFTTMQTSRGCPVALRVLRHSDLQRRQVARAERPACGERVQVSRRAATGRSILSTTISCFSRNGSRPSAKA